MLIFEGPDGAGKTTLIEAFQEAFGTPISPRVVSKDTQAMVDLRGWVDNNLDRGFQDMIFDRHRLISETIYGPILREHAQPGFDKVDWLAPRLKRFYNLQPIIIYCLPPFKTVWNNITGDPDNTAVLSKIESIYSAYAARAAFDYALSPGTVKIWDYTTSPTILDEPIWFNQVHMLLKERTHTLKKGTQN